MDGTGLVAGQKILRHTGESAMRGYLVGVEDLGCNMGCRSSLMGPGNPATGSGGTNAPLAVAGPHKRTTAHRRGHPSKTSPRWGPSTVGQSCLDPKVVSHPKEVLKGAS